MATATDARRQLEPLLAVLFDGAEGGAWRKCVVTPAKQSTFLPWQKLTAQPVKLSRGTAIKVVTRVGTAESTVTLSLEKWPGWFEEAIESGPCHLDVMAGDHDWHARRTRDGRWLVTRAKPSAPSAPAEPVQHDRRPLHALRPENERVRQLFIETGLFGKNGHLLGEAAAKHRQVQHYIELLRHLPVWQSEGAIRVVDAGCGKAYLSLALCLWAELNGREVHLDGVDSSPDLIATVEGIAARIGLRHARFHASSIADFARGREGDVDVLLSLHACDTATDEALAAGVKLRAKALVLVPCCHHELFAQMEDNTRSADAPAAVTWKAAMRHGLTAHRVADLVTDSLRASALEALGYSVDVVEFVSPEATARNLMIRAVRPAAARGEAAASALTEYRALAEAWKVKPALEDLLGPLWPGTVAS